MSCAPHCVAWHFDVSCHGFWISRSAFHARRERQLSRYASQPNSTVCLDVCVDFSDICSCDFSHFMGDSILYHRRRKRFALAQYKTRAVRALGRSHRFLRSRNFEYSNLWKDWNNFRSSEIRRLQQSRSVACDGSRSRDECSITRMENKNIHSQSEELAARIWL